MLRWLGLDWDGEPVHQSDRLASTRAAAQQLFDGGHAYYCDCTAEEVQARAKAAAALPATTASAVTAVSNPARVALRFRTPDDGVTAWDDVIRGKVRVENSTIEDFVLLRSSGTPTFLLANVVDDVAMGITHVIRGEDHVNGTPKYLLLRAALGITDMPVFAHLPLLVNEQRKKLSKRRDDVSVASYRDQGFLPEAMRNYLALLGWGPPDGVEVRPIEEIVELFRLEDVNPSPAFFDLKKLTYVNAEWIRYQHRRTTSSTPAAYITDKDEQRAAGARAARAGAREGAQRARRAVRLGARPGRRPAFVGQGHEARRRAARPRRHRRRVRVGALGARRTARGVHRWPSVSRSIREAARSDPRAGHRSHRRTAAVRAARVARARRVAGAAHSGRADERLACAVERRVLRGRRCRRRLLVSYVGVTFAQVWSASRQDHAQPAQAIIVLGAAQYNGTPSPALASRLDHAIDLYQRGMAPLIVVTGGRQPGDAFTEAEASANYLADHGIPGGAVERETTSTNSYDELAATARFLKARGITDVVLVSDPFHSYRIDDIARRRSACTRTSRRRRRACSTGSTR